MKLQQGDYVTDLTEEQFDELIEIEGFEYKLPYNPISKVIVFDGEALYKCEPRINPLPFTEFKQRAINTFER